MGLPCLARVAAPLFPPTISVVLLTPFPTGSDFVGLVTGTGGGFFVAGPFAPATEVILDPDTLLTRGAAATLTVDFGLGDVPAVLTLAMVEVELVLVDEALIFLDLTTGVDNPTLLPELAVLKLSLVAVSVFDTLDVGLELALEWVDSGLDID